MKTFALVMLLIALFGAQSIAAALSGLLGDGTLRDSALIVGGLMLGHVLTEILNIPTE
jgi:hypothetical protein